MVIISCLCVFAFTGSLSEQNLICEARLRAAVHPLSAEEHREVMLAPSSSHVGENEGRTTSNLIHIQHMQTKFAAHHLDGLLQALFSDMQVKD